MLSEGKSLVTALLGVSRAVYANLQALVDLQAGPDGLPTLRPEAVETEIQLLQLRGIWERQRQKSALAGGFVVEVQGKTIRPCPCIKQFPTPEINGRTPTDDVRTPITKLPTPQLTQPSLRHRKHYPPQFSVVSRITERGRARNGPGCCTTVANH